jgi:thiamine-phosphate pyrophosphorylase
MAERAEIRGLYVIISPDQTRGRDEIDVARAVLEGGARLLQYRDKQRDKGDQLPIVRRLVDLCREHGALLFVNDHVDLALAAGAPGVHLGQHDLPLEEARRIAGDRLRIGISTNNVEEARAAVAGGAAYIAVGAIFATSTKGNTRPASPERLREVREAVEGPIVAIGGINATNIDQVLEAGADAVAVISAVTLAHDVRAAAQALSERIAAYYR